MRQILLTFRVFSFFLLPVLQVNAGSYAVGSHEITAAFAEFERQIIYKYFERHPEYGGHDCRDSRCLKEEDDRRELPPRIMKLRKGDILPPGIAKKQLPPGLEGDLPAPQRGYERVIIGDDIVLVEIDTNRIADIIIDVMIRTEKEKQHEA